MSTFTTATDNLLLRLVDKLDSIYKSQLLIRENQSLIKTKLDAISEILEEEEAMETSSDEEDLGETQIYEPQVKIQKKQ